MGLGLGFRVGCRVLGLWFRVGDDRSVEWCDFADVSGCGAAVGLGPGCRLQGVGCMV